MPPRFVLVLAARPHQIRAALVLQTGRVASSAKQAYQLSDASADVNTFEPTKVWYKIKQVTAASLDIARTQPREIAAVALVHAATGSIIWTERDGETFAQGIAGESSLLTPEQIQDLIRSFLKTETIGEAFTSTLYLGGMDAWLVWNLTGEFVTTEQVSNNAVESPDPRVNITVPRLCATNAVDCFGKARIRGPFAGEFPVAAVLNENAALNQGAALNETDAALVGAALTAFQAIGYL